MLENYYYRRLIAKSVDVIVIYAIAKLLAAFFSPFGILAGVGALLLSDAIGGGDGLAKRFFGLKVVPSSARSSDPAQYLTVSITWQQSVLRNLPLAIVVGLAVIPFMGTVILSIFGIPYALFETYLIYSVNGQIRLGDVMAQTMVADMTPHRNAS